LLWGKRRCKRKDFVSFEIVKLQVKRGGHIGSLQVLDVEVDHLSFLPFDEPEHLVGFHLNKPTGFGSWAGNSYRERRQERPGSNLRFRTTEKVSGEASSCVTRGRKNLLKTTGAGQLEHEWLRLFSLVFSHLVPYAYQH
jgi:hypothetical protein